MKKIELNQEFTVDFTPGKRVNERPICRINGKVAFLNSSDNTHVELLSSWIVRVDVIKDKFLIVTPLVIWRTADQNKTKMEEGLKSLITHSKERRRKPKFKAAL
jgi:hypothetical protein